MDEPDNILQSLIEPACRVIAEGRIHSIFVSTGRRLTPAELHEARISARKHGVIFAELDPGTVVVRGGTLLPARSRRHAIRGLISRILSASPAHSTRLRWQQS